MTGVMAAEGTGTAMVETLRGTGCKTLAETIDGVLFDLDGVVYRGAHAVEHAPTAIATLQIPTGFVTNNAGRTPEDIAAHLTNLGVAVSRDQVTTSAQAAAGYIAANFGTEAKILMVGGEGLEKALLENGLTLVSSAEDHPQVVVQGTSRDITWGDLAEAVYAINAGASHIATNLDSTMPTDRGVTLGNGALVQAVTHATGKPIDAFAGKPDPQIFHHAASRAGMQTPLVVGDRTDTDIAGAVSANMAGLVVFTGVVGPRDVLLSPPDQRPTFLAHDLRGLHEVHPEISVEGSIFQCAQASAQIEAGQLIVRTGDRTTNLSSADVAVAVSLDELRAACAAVWAAPESVDLAPLIRIHE